jgi:signal transduction histidine kinase
LLVVFALIAFFMIRNASASLTTSLNQQSRAFASLATKPVGDSYSLYKDSGTLKIKQQMQAFTDLDSNIDNIVISSVDGSQLFSFNNKLKLHIPAGEAESFDTVTHSSQKGLISQITQPYFDDSGQHPYGITYHVSTSALTAEINREVESIVIFSILALVISAFATYELINSFFLRPIQEVSRMSGVIAAGYYSQQITLARQDEIGQLAGSVNRMASALKANIQQLQELDKVKNEFIMITSHNLRTPLTIIEGNLSLLHNKGLSEEVIKMLGDVENSARELNSFSEQMLTIASIEVGHSIGSFETIKLGDILLPLEQKFAPLATNKGIGLEFDHSNDSVALEGSARQLKGALANILDNALKFTKEGKVAVTSSTDSNKLKITVSDTGIGIKAAELPKIFTKFHRGTDTLQYNYEGTGIGLYAAKLIVEQHRGVITAKSEEGKGSTFTIELPVKTAAPAIENKANPA